MTKEAWPVCVDEGMDAVACKEFIDYEIFNYFTEQDQFIRTRIIGKRSFAEDDWYNVIVIMMDE